MKLTSTTILVAGIGLLDLVQGWDFIAQFVGMKFLEAPAALASGAALLITTWIIIQSGLRLAARACTASADAMEYMVTAVNQYLFGGIAAGAKAVFSWAMRKRGK